MSRIYFHAEDPSETVDISGSERAHGQQLMLKIPQSVIYDQTFGGDRHPVTRYFPAEWKKNFPYGYPEAVAHYLERPSIFGSGSPIDFGGTVMWGTALLANTAIRLGSDAVKLLVRLHMRCEVHSWVDGPNRAWLAEIIRKGRAAGVLREDMGWENLSTLLLSNTTDPLVTSYSVSDSFPNSVAADWTGPEGMHSEDVKEAWNDLSRKTRWAICMANLRRQEAEDPEGMFLELKPGNWDGYFYGKNLTIMDLNQADMRERHPRKEISK